MTSRPQGMNSDRWRRIEEICDGALRLEAAGRAAYLATECGADDVLRREVEALLAHEDSAEGFLAAPVGALAARVFAAPPERDLVGARIGDYDIVARLGAGGMGVVYRAKDRRLGRDVAFKVLPTALELDEPRLARFDREARFLAAVNHPHIGSIYGFVEANGIRALALELVEGETLAAVLRRGPIPMERSLVLAAQVADALDHAHRRGVLHRDLKPSNIMLTSGGVKLLDFGVGKWSPKDGESPLPGFSTLTEDGAVVGTIHYMSPEQLEGRTAEARSDLFSFGAVLFEMLAGRMAFDGPSQASIIAAILNGPTPRLPEMGGVSLPRLERVVAKCLAKDPDERWQSARDLGDELRWLADDVARPLTAAAGGSTSLPRPDLVTPRPQKAIAAAAVIATALLGWAAWTRWPAVSAGVVSAPALRFVVQPPPGVRVNVGDFRVSSDGTQLAYSSGQKLYLRRFDRLETIALPGTDHEVINLDFSPDGNWIAFAELRAEGPNGFTLRKVRATGETGPVVLIESLPSVTSMIWPTPDTIFFAAVDHPIQRVFADGGQATPVTTRTESEIDHHTPQLLPGGDALLFAVHAKGDRFSIAVQSLKSGERRTLIESGFAPQYSPTGHLVFARRNAVFAVPFNPDRLEVTGTPVPVIQQVRTVHTSGIGAFQVTAAGILSYRPQPSIAGRVLTWVDRTGSETPIRVPRGGFDTPRVSPDGKHVAFTATAEGDRRDIFTYEVATEHLTRVTDAGNNWGPLWTRDGSALVYVTDRDGASELVLRRLDGSALVPLGTTSNEAYPAAFAADQHTLIVNERPPTDAFFVTQISTKNGGRLEPLLKGPGPRGASISPDGRWIAYTDNASLRTEVFVQSFPIAGVRRQVSVDGGREAVWRRDGKELFYRSGSRMFAVPLDTARGLSFGKPTLLFERNHAVTSSFLDYDVAPDGRFLSDQARP